MLKWEIKMFLLILFILRDISILKFQKKNIKNWKFKFWFGLNFKIFQITNFSNGKKIEKIRFCLQIRPPTHNCAVSAYSAHLAFLFTFNLPIIMCFWLLLELSCTSKEKAQKQQQLKNKRNPNIPTSASRFST